jgi:hypothetical protein
LLDVFEQLLNFTDKRPVVVGLADEFSPRLVDPRPVNAAAPNAPEHDKLRRTLPRLPGKGVTDCLFLGIVQFHIEHNQVGLYLPC